MSGRSDVIEPGDRSVMRGKTRKRPPKKKLTGSTGTCVRITAYQIDVSLFQIRCRDHDALSHGRNHIRYLLFQLSDDTIGKLFAKRFRPLASGRVQCMHRQSACWEALAVESNKSRIRQVRAKDQQQLVGQAQSWDRLGEGRVPPRLRLGKLHPGRRRRTR
jgi:hypothetical protein